MGIPVGLSDLYYAIMTDEKLETYEVPERIPGLMTMKVSPKTSTETLYADDGPAESVTSIGEIDVEFEVKDIPIDVQSKILGHTINTDGALVRKTTDVPPYVAIGYKRLMNDGKYRYKWIHKMKFELFEESAETKGDKPKFQTPTLKGKAVKRDTDGIYDITVDEGSENAKPDVIANWFKNVYIGPVGTGA